MIAMTDLSSAPHNPQERIRWLRDEAGALLSMARDIEMLLPHPHEHLGCVVCEECRLEIIDNAKRFRY